MSVKKGKDVFELVRNYRAGHPTMKRSEIRKNIRLQNPDLFSSEKTSSSASNLKKLDRYLGRAFKLQDAQSI